MFFWDCFLSCLLDAFGDDDEGLRSIDQVIVVVVVFVRFPYKHAGHKLRLS